ncbi:MAG: UDP-N-acetylglucosamine 2-epimerase, partial [Bacillota bacterium]|nr:UDP-N-acetylglucosamine 2-epimerase [Bacillota bacterium]
TKYKDKIDKSNVLEELGLKEKQYILVSAHREENIDIEENFMSLMTAINNVAKKYDMPVIYSTHPRSKKFIDNRNFVFDKRVKSLKPFGFFDYNKLQKNAYCVLSDSGTLSEESAMLNFSAVLIRTSTERPEALDAGSIIIGGITTETIQQSIDMAVEMNKNNEIMGMANDYNDINVSIKVVKLIQSYTDIVNRTVWNKR